VKSQSWVGVSSSGGCSSFGGVVGSPEAEERESRLSAVV
jgi:hypothetical protein